MNCAMETKHKFRSATENFYEETNLIEVSNYLYSHWRWVAGIVFTSVVTTILATLLFSTPKYSSTSTVLYNTSSKRDSLIQDSFNQWNMEYEVDNKLFALSTFVHSEKYKKALAEEIVIGSRQLNTKTEQEISFKTLKEQLVPEQYNPETLGNHIFSLVSVSTDSVRRIIIFKATHKNPEVAQSLANLCAALLIDLNYDHLLKELNSVLSFVSTQTQETQNELSKLENNLSELQKETQYLSIQELSAIVDTQKVEQNIIYQKYKFEEAASRLLIKELETAIREFKDNIQNTTNSHLYQIQLQNRLDSLLYKKSVIKNDRAIASVNPTELEAALEKVVNEFKTSFDEKNDLLGNPWEYLASLEKSYGTAKNKLKEIQSQISALKVVKKSEKEVYEKLPDILKKMSQIKRDISITSELYQQLKSKLQETQIKKSGQANDLELLHTAEMTSVPTGLKLWKKVVLAFVVSLVGSIVFLVLKYVLIPTIRSSLAFRKNDVEVIAEVPYVKFSSESKEHRNDYPLLFNWKPNSDETNTLRQARFNLQEKLNLYNSRENKISKIITICSSSSKEGKSFVASNLAYAFSLANFKVLLIDLDILNSSVKSYFDKLNIEKTSINVQATDKLNFNQFKINEFLDTVEIPYTERNISDILETPVLGDYLSNKKMEYDVIIIDTPPLRNSLEAFIASRFSDAMVLVANQRTSLKYDLQNSILKIRETFNRDVYGVLNFSYDEINSSRRRIKKTAA